MLIWVKNINSIINILVKIIHYAMFFYIAIILSNVFWWIFTPNNPRIEYNTVLAKFDDAEKFIVNRKPFGLMLEVKDEVKAKPTIASLIKITGIYANDTKHSFVFYELNGKNSLGRVGDKLDSAIITQINSNGIVINDNGHNFPIEFVKSDHLLSTSNNDKPNENTSPIANNSTNKEELSKKREQLIQEFTNYKESIK
jgi:type II secretory pathway component PulC